MLTMIQCECFHSNLTNNILRGTNYILVLGRDNDFNFSIAKPFISQFIRTIKDFNLEQTLSLRLFPGDGFTGAFELTEGRANINLLPDQVCAN